VYRSCNPSTQKRLLTQKRSLTKKGSLTQKKAPLGIKQLSRPDPCAKPKAWALNQAHTNPDKGPTHKQGKL